jgi:hypothetical protein
MGLFPGVSRLLARPGPTSHSVDDRAGDEMVEVAGGGGYAGVAELLGNDDDVDPFSAKLCGVGVPQAMSVDTLFNARPIWALSRLATPWPRRSLRQALPQIPRFIPAAALPPPSGRTHQAHLSRRSAPLPPV